MVFPAGISKISYFYFKPFFEASFGIIEGNLMLKVLEQIFPGHFLPSPLIICLLLFGFHCILFLIFHYEVGVLLLLLFLKLFYLLSQSLFIVFAQFFFH